MPIVGMFIVRSKLRIAFRLPLVVTSTIRLSDSNSVLSRRKTGRVESKARMMAPERVVSIMRAQNTPNKINIKSWRHLDRPDLRRGGFMS